MSSIKKKAGFFFNKPLSQEEQEKNKLCNRIPDLKKPLKNKCLQLDSTDVNNCNDRYPRENDKFSESFGICISNKEYINKPLEDRKRTMDENMALPVSYARPPQLPPSNIDRFTNKIGEVGNQFTKKVGNQFTRPSSDYTVFNYLKYGPEKIEIDPAIQYKKELSILEKQLKTLMSKPTFFDSERQQIERQIIALNNEYIQKGVPINIIKQPRQLYPQDEDESQNGGKGKTYKHTNGKHYKIRTGKRGGHYILVGPENKKIYI